MALFAPLILKLFLTYHMAAHHMFNSMHSELSVLVPQSPCPPSINVPRAAGVIDLPVLHPVDRADHALHPRILIGYLVTAPVHVMLEASLIDHYQMSSWMMLKASRFSPLVVNRFILYSR